MTRAETQADPRGFVVQPPWGGARAALWALVCANGAMALGVLVLGLSVYQVTVIYWFETVIIGLFSLAKLALAATLGNPYRNRLMTVSRSASLLMSALLAGVFVAKFGTGVLGIGLVLLYLPGELAGLDGASSSIVDGFTEMTRALSLAAAPLALSHGFSLVVNFVLRGEYRHARGVSLLLWPYARCLWMFFVLILAWLLAASRPELSSSAVFAATVIFIKVIGDLVTHRVERRIFAPHRS